VSERIAISDIRADPAAQPRTSILTDKVTEYVEDLANGDSFPPLVVFFDGSTHWLADGFHRYHAAVGLGLAEFECDVRKGALRDAVLFSCGANAAHGVRRTNEDKRRAVMKLLQDDEWSHWSDSEIARQCRVGNKFVGDQRRKLIPPVTLSGQSDRTYTNKHGGTSRMNTSAIGRSETRKPAAPSVESPAKPFGATPERAAEIARDNANSWISAALWEIERRIGSLGNPEDAARNFPLSHRHTFTSEKLAEMAEWLTAFAEAWNDLEANDVAAQ